MTFSFNLACRTWSRCNSSIVGGSLRVLLIQDCHCAKLTRSAPFRLLEEKTDEVLNRPHTRSAVSLQRTRRIVYTSSNRSGLPHSYCELYQQDTGRAKRTFLRLRSFEEGIVIEIAANVILLLAHPEPSQ